MRPVCMAWFQENRALGEQLLFSLLILGEMAFQVSFSSEPVASALVFVSVTSMALVLKKTEDV